MSFVKIFSRPLFLFQIAVIFLIFAASSISSAAVAFRSKTYSNNAGTGTSATPTEPAGAAQNDILIMAVAADAVTSGFSTPTGWTQIYSHTAGGNMEAYVYWIRRGSSPPSYTISWTTSAWVEISITAWSGVVLSGNPYDVMASNPIIPRNPSNPDCPSVTTTVANTLVVALGLTWSGWDVSGATPPTGYTLHQGGPTEDFGVASKLKATAGAENPSAYTYAAGTSNDVAEITIALKPAIPPPIRHKVINE